MRCDIGAELTANALRDCCRFSQAATSYIEPGSPWQNPYVESFGSRIRGELLSGELLETLAEAQVLVEDWRLDYTRSVPTRHWDDGAPAHQPTILIGRGPMSGSGHQDPGEGELPGRAALLDGKLADPGCQTLVALERIAVPARIGTGERPRRAPRVS